MVNQTDIRRLDSLAKIIRKFKEIKKAELYRECSLSMTQLNRLHPVIPVMYEDIVWDKSNQKYICVSV